MMKSRRQAFETIELANTQVSNEQVGKFLQDSKADLIQHLNFYSKSVTDRKLDKPVSDDEKQFLEKASNQLNVSVSVCYNLLTGLIKQKITSSESFDSSNFKLDDKLVDQLQYYLFSEKEATLGLWSSILRSCQFEEHLFFEETSAFVNSCFENNAQAHAFAVSLLQEFSSLTKVMIPSNVLHEADHAKRWALHYLNLQRGLLEVFFFLYYTPLQSEPLEAIEYLENFSECRLGIDQNMSSLFDEELLETHKSVVQLAVLCCLDVLNLESLGEWPVERLSSAAKCLFSITPASQSPFMLAVGLLLVANGVDFGVELVQRAVKLGAFSVLSEMTTSKLNAQKEVSKGYKSVIKGLLILFIRLFPVNTFSRDDSIVELACNIFRDCPELATQYWEHDYNIPECSELLTVARNRFPLVSKPLIQLLISLSGDQNSALYTSRYLEETSVFCDFADSSRWMMTMETNVCEFVESGLLPFNGLNIKIPPHTQAQLIAQNVVSLNLNYSIWHYSICVLDFYVQKGSVSIYQDGVNNCILALELFFKVLSAGGQQVYSEWSSHVNQFISSAEFFKLLGKVLVRASSSLSTSSDIAAQVFSLFELLFPFEPELVLKHLMTESAIGLAMPLMSSRFLQNILHFEKSRANYPLTLAYVSMITVVLEKDLNVLDKLAVGLRLVIDQIWCKYLHWRYMDIKQQSQMSFVLVKLLNIVADSANLHESCESIINQLCDNVEKKTLDPLLHIVTVGHDNLISLYASEKFGDALDSEKTLVGSLHLLVNLLGNYRIIHQHVCSFSFENKDILQILGKYIHYQFLPEIPLQSTIALSLVIRNANDYSFSLLGYFGSSASSILSKYLQIASNAVSEALQSEVFNLFSAIFSSQLSLAMLLESTESIKLFKESHSQTLLDVILEILKDIENISSEKPRLLSSVVSLCSVFWIKDSKKMLEVLGKEAVFWNALLRLLGTEIEFPAIDEETDSLQLVQCCYLMNSKNSAMKIFAVEGFGKSQIKYVQQGLDLLKTSIKDGSFEKDVSLQFNYDFYSQIANECSELGVELSKLKNLKIYGDEYVYRLDNSKAAKLRGHISQLNWMWSIADAQLVALKTWIFCFRTIELNLDYMNLLERVLKLCTLEKRLEYPFSELKTELCASVLFFTSKLDRKDSRLGTASQICSLLNSDLGKVESLESNLVASLLYILEKTDKVNSDTSVWTVIASTVCQLITSHVMNLNGESDLLEIHLSLLSFLALKMPTKTTLLTIINQTNLISQLLELLVSLIRVESAPSKLVGKLVDCIIVLAASCPQLASALCNQGLITAISSSDLSPLLSEGQLDCYQSVGWHSVWCQFIDLFSALQLSIPVGHAIISLVQQFWNQISKSLNMSSEPQLSLRQLQEIKLLTRLVCLLANEKTLYNNQLVNSTLHLGIHTLILGLSKYLVFLLNHPKLLSSRIIPRTKAESGMTIKQTGSSTEFIVESRKLITDILDFSVSFLFQATGAYQLVNPPSDPSLWNSTQFVSCFNSWFSASDLVDIGLVLEDSSVDAVALLLAYEFLHSQDLNCRDELYGFVKSKPKIKDKFQVIQKILQ